MTGPNWVVLFEAGPVDAVRAAFDEWRAATARRRTLADDAFRLDLIRTVDGDRLRVMLDRMRAGGVDGD